MLKNIFLRHIALPQDHGSWVFILSPLLIGLFAAERFTPGSLAVILAAMAAFLIRQPVTMAIKAYSGRRSRGDLPAARFWMVVYGVIVLLAVGELVYLGYSMILWLAVPALPVFAWHLYLVSRRAERRQAGIEILATGVLALAAPAALWAGSGLYRPEGWWLWILAWFQSAASIIHAYLRLEQREWKSIPPRPEQLRAGRRALTYTSFNLAAALGLGLTGFLPTLIFIPYLLQWAETVWCTFNPAVNAKPVAIGVRQLVVSTLFTALFIVFWR
jgi:hypothetical protein